MFQRCIKVGLIQFSLKQVNKGKCTAVRRSLGYLLVLITNYLDKFIFLFLSLNHQYMFSYTKYKILYLGTSFFYLQSQEMYKITQVLFLYLYVYFVHLCSVLLMF